MAFTDSVVEVQNGALYTVGELAIPIKMFNIHTLKVTENTIIISAFGNAPTVYHRELSS